jgi:hydrogenase maturation protein HypF
LAFTWDGTGYGPDGTTWGGEVLRARVEGYERVASLWPFPLPGGEQAIREPARVGLALAAAALGKDVVLSDVDLLKRLDLTPAAAGTLLRMAERGVNSPVATSLGRLFDGVTALVLGANRVSYEGEAAAWLESTAGDPCSPLPRAGAEGPGVTASAPRRAYPFPLVSGATDLPRGDWRTLVRSVLVDLRDVTAPAVIAARFHEAVADWAAAVAEQHPGLPIVLAGGCFLNRRLLEGTISRLEAAGRRASPAGRIPPGDGGLAAGQLGATLAALAMKGLD